ncbi:hypothetical protein X742_13870 [Mesorhizobium sp. LNHC232B00]|nr:hypothetical protein X742_13870 [Mesorhizobium sp. LNHC232B00]
MTTTIDINGTLTLDQTSGAQSGDTAISSDLTGLSTAFKDFLNGLTGDLQLSAGQFAFADNVEAAVSGAGLVTVTPDGATISKLFFSDGSGNALDGDQVIYNGSPLLTVDGSQPIYLHSYANGTIVLATTSATEGVGDVVAAFYLNAAGNNLSASVEMVTFQAIAHPDTTNPDDAIDWTNLLNVSASGSTSFNFDNLASGNNLFVAVGTSGAGLVVSGIHPVIKADGTLDNSGDNIKTSQGGVGATIGVNNQMFDPGETAVFSFVKGQAPGTYGDIDNMSYTDFIDVTDAKLFISQTEGSPGTNFTVKIGAFSAGGASTSPEAGRSYIDNNLASGANLGNDAGQSALADDSAVAIVRVVIRDGNGGLVTDTTATNGFVTFNADGTITAQHLNDAYTVQWFTDNSATQAVETFNRFQATAVVGKFDVGRVDLSQGVTVTESVGDKLHTNDDGPTAALTENAAKVLHDETSGVDANSNDQSGAAPAAFTALGTVLGLASMPIPTTSPVRLQPPSPRSAPCLAGRPALPPWSRRTPASAPTDRAPRRCRSASAAPMPIPASIHSTTTTSCSMSRVASSSAALTSTTTATRRVNPLPSPSRSAKAASSASRNTSPSRIRTAPMPTTSRRCSTVRCLPSSTPPTVTATPATPASPSGTRCRSGTTARQRL